MSYMVTYANKTEAGDSINLSTEQNLPVTPSSTNYDPTPIASLLRDGDYTKFINATFRCSVWVQNATAGDTFDIYAFIGNAIGTAIYCQSETKTITISSGGQGYTTVELPVNYLSTLETRFRIKSTPGGSNTGSTACKMFVCVDIPELTDINNRVDVGTILGEVPLSENTIAETVNEALVSEHGDGQWGNLIVRPSEV